MFLAAFEKDGICLKEYTQTYSVHVPSLDADLDAFFLSLVIETVKNIIQEIQQAY